MIPRRPIDQTNKPPDVEEGTVEVSGPVSASEKRQLDQIADDLEISENTLFHEAVALMLTEHGKALPPALVEHLETDGRPLPSGAKRAPKIYRFH